jgi:hypothetical protein
MRRSRQSTSGALGGRRRVLVAACGQFVWVVCRWVGAPRSRVSMAIPSPHSMRGWSLSLNLSVWERSSRWADHCMHPRLLFLYLSCRHILLAADPPLAERPVPALAGPLLHKHRPEEARHSSSERYRSATYGWPCAEPAAGSCT